MRRSINHWQNEGRDVLLSREHQIAGWSIYRAPLGRVVPMYEGEDTVKTSGFISPVNYTLPEAWKHTIYLQDAKIISDSTAHRCRKDLEVIRAHYHSGSREISDEEYIRNVSVRYGRNEEKKFNQRDVYFNQTEVRTGRVSSRDLFNREMQRVISEDTPRNSLALMSLEDLLGKVEKPVEPPPPGGPEWTLAECEMPDAFGRISYLRNMLEK